VQRSGDDTNPQVRGLVESRNDGDDLGRAELIMPLSWEKKRLGNEQITTGDARSDLRRCGELSCFPSSGGWVILENEKRNGHTRRIGVWIR